ncbi:MAG TPA: AbrB family transcriptional regulator [Pseudolabrys sp.]|nr:AbrB family transcriptional regulator [Pseudolabrys sp.]
MLAPSPLTRTETIRHIAETLVVGAVGGIALGRVGFPAGWLSGSMLAVAIAALIGRPMAIPTWLARVVYILVGISLGAVVTPETLRGIATWPLSVAALAVAVVCITLGASAYLRAVHGWDRNTSMLASSPGALSQVLIMATDLGVDLRAVAIVQSIRIVIVAVGLPIGLVALGLAGATTRTVGGPFRPDLIGELAILVVSSIILAIAFYRLRFPGGLLFGAMLMSAVLHGSGYVHAVMPWWVVIGAMITLGAVTGSRFANTPLRLLLRFVGAAFGSFAVAISIASLFVVALATLSSFNAAGAAIAFAPGAVDVMMVLALALNLDPVYVGAHHLARIIFVSLSLPLLVRHTRSQTAEAALPPRPPVEFRD